jgi:hypothetical protein
LTITDNAANSPQAVALTGTGTAPEASLSPSTLTFGSQIVGGSSGAQSLTLANTGSAALAISAISLTGPAAGDFSFQNACGAALNPGANCGLSVTFTPTASGTRTATLAIATNAATSPQSVMLTGTGTAPQASVSPSSLSFANQVVGVSSGALGLTVTNTGTAALTLNGVAVTGANSKDFSLQNNCGNSLNPGASCGMNLTFTPISAGTRTAALTLTTNAAGSPQAVALTGVGTDFSLNVPAGSSSTLTVVPGQQVAFHVTLSPGGIKDAVSFTCAGAPAESTCQVSPTTATLDGVTPLTVNVTVQTTAPSGSVFRNPHLPWGLEIAARPLPGTLMLLVGLTLLFAMVAACRRRAAWGVATLLLSGLLLAGCGVGGQVSGLGTSQPGTPVGSYALTFTATSPEASHSLALTLNVQPN